VNSATAGDRLNFSQLQGQRGLAALGVVVFHAYQYDRSGPDASFPYQGTVADTALRALDGLVDWFFVLSAFLLALPYAKAVLRGSSTVGPGTFLARRAVRIVPLYLVAITLVWASRNPSLPGDWRDLLEVLSFTQVFDTKRIFYTIGPAWSLAVEAQFYLLLALLGSLFVAGARRCSSARVRVVVAFSRRSSSRIGVSVQLPDLPPWAPAQSCPVLLRRGARRRPLSTLLSCYGLWLWEFWCTPRLAAAAPAPGTSPST
jgi:peptidoglycan/LPS O-acetylase OafA/YrhL